MGEERDVHPRHAGVAHERREQHERVIYGTLFAVVACAQQQHVEHSIRAATCDNSFKACVVGGDAVQEVCGGSDGGAGGG